MEERLTSFSGDFHASNGPSPWQVTKKDGRTIDTFGLNFRAWSEKLDRFGSLLKTYLESSTLPGTMFARIWSVSFSGIGKRNK